MRWLGIAVMLCGLTACSKSEDAGGEPGKSESAKSNGQKTQPPAKPRNDDYPKDVPDPLFAEIVGIKSMDNTVTVRLKTDRKSIIETGQWFADRLKKLHWKQSLSTIDANASYVDFRKNGRKCTVTITRGNSDREVRILVTVTER